MHRPKDCRSRRQCLSHCGGHESLPLHVRIVIVEPDVGPGQHLGEVRAQHLSRAMCDFRDRVDQIRREDVATPCTMR
jgi:hypothetical protein